MIDAFNAHLQNRLLNKINNQVKRVFQMSFTDVSGKIVLQTYNDNNIIEYEYLPSFGFKRFQLSLMNATTFKLYYQNGNASQTLLKMETFIVNDYNILLQQTTQIPYPLGVSKNQSGGGPKRGGQGYGQKKSEQWGFRYLETRRLGHRVAMKPGLRPMRFRSAQ
jgi:hypothetical protein